MASSSGIRRPFRHRAASTSQIGLDISAPMLTFTNADHRFDLHAIAPKLTRSATTREVRPGPSKLKKRHIADLAVGRTPMFPPAPKTSVPTQRAPSPTSIGIALGSPTYQRSTQQPNNTRPTDADPLKTNGRPSISNTSQSSQNSNTSSRRKMLFSSIFGRKTSIRATEPEFYPIQPSGISQNLVDANKQKLISQGIEKAASSDTTAPTPHLNQENQKQSNIPRPELQKTATLPFAYSSRAPSPPPKDSLPHLSISRKASDRRCSNCNPRSPMLKVEIPDIKLDRYSVMFHDILKRPRQSLSARRHIHLEGLRISGTANPRPSRIDEESLELGADDPFSYPFNPQSHITERTKPSDNIPGIYKPNAIVQTAYSQFPAGTVTYPKRTDSHIARSRSPSHGSETPRSANSDWQLSGSPQSSSSSDEEFDDSLCENIIIRLEDASLQQNPSLQQRNGLTIETQRTAVPLSATTNIVQPVTGIPANPRDTPGRSQRYARESSHDRSGTKYTLIPSSTVSRSDRAPVASIPVVERTTASRQQPAWIQSYYQPTTETQPLRHLNPLKSSPASPTEIRTARKLSSGRPQQVTIINSKQPIQLQITNIVNTAGAATLEPNKIAALTAAHARNRSQQVVIESI